MKTENNLDKVLEALEFIVLNEDEVDATCGGFIIFGHDTKNFPLWGEKGLAGVALVGLIVCGYVGFRIKRGTLFNQGQPKMHNDAIKGTHNKNMPNYGSAGSGDQGPIDQKVEGNPRNTELVLPNEHPSPIAKGFLLDRINPETRSVEGVKYHKYVGREHIVWLSEEELRGLLNGEKTRDEIACLIPGT